MNKEILKKYGLIGLLLFMFVGHFLMQDSKSRALDREVRTSQSIATTQAVQQLADVVETTQRHEIKFAEKKIKVLHLKERIIKLENKH